MRIALFTSGRFHLCDIAREFNALGHEVKLYSLVPPWKTKTFGVPSASNVWLAPKVAYSLARVMLAKSPDAEQKARERLAIRLDKVAAKALKQCDVFIGMSGMSNLVGQRARQAFKAHVRIQRCSRHIQSQADILAQLPNSEQVSTFDIKRELIDYQLADVVDVPAEHCLESFLERGFSKEKLFCNPFGVNLSEFKPADQMPTVPTIIMVGTWSYRKGCDVLLDAWRSMSAVRLMHVGPAGDFPLPTDDGFVHFDSVPQHELLTYYHQAQVMCLASREEGLAFVQPQALACGLNLVCTDRTGGGDLKKIIEDVSSITVVACEDTVALRQAMENALRRTANNKSGRDLLGPIGREQLSWRGYAQRYLAAIETARCAASH